MQPSNNQVPQPQQSNILRLIKVAAEYVADDASGLINQMIPEKHLKKFHQLMPLLSFAGMPKPEVMLSSVFEKLSELPEAFWIEIESMVMGVIVGEPESEEKLLSLIGVITNADQHTTG